MLVALVVVLFQCCQCSELSRFLIFFSVIYLSIMPKTLRSGERELVLKVKRFCEREKTNKAPLIPFENVRRRVAAMTGISEKTVTKICQEGVVTASTNQITPDIWKNVITSDVSKKNIMPMIWNWIKKWIISLLK
ncbi:uncharacterized protein LOC123659880 [Melitaea cinxia]|uniref:uncharacterized protein LOC123659880 n=1 Tax=Melitaea cinxia TaxID=113334 RepID=UPI001E26EF04|nr:uncharacterized protein LOC123659880 [Melitaea cinxia]